MPQRPMLEKKWELFGLTSGEFLQVFVTPFICGKADLVFFPVESHTEFPQHYHEVKLDSNIQEDSMPILAFFAK